MLAYAFRQETITNYIYDFSKHTSFKTVCRLNTLKFKEYISTEQIILLVMRGNEVIGTAVLKEQGKGLLWQRLRVYVPEIIFLLYPLINMVNFKRAKLLNGLLKLEEKPAAKYIILEAIGVDENFQGQGIGKRLLKRVEEIATDRGYDGIYLYTADKNNYEIYNHFNYSLIAERGNEELKIYHMYKDINEKGSK